jgi:hypothetical protein
MADTPEKKVKRKVSETLKRFEPDVFYTMPVPSGYGESTLDYLGCAWGNFFAIETKGAAGKEPTDRQKQTIAMMQRAGGKVFVCTSQSEIDDLTAWLMSEKRKLR